MRIYIYNIIILVLIMYVYMYVYIYVYIYVYMYIYMCICICMCMCICICIYICITNYVIQKKSKLKFLTFLASFSLFNFEKKNQKTSERGHEAVPPPSDGVVWSLVTTCCLCTPGTKSTALLSSIAHSKI